MQSPKPRPGVYDLYWKFTAERQKIFERRATGTAGPWTTDPILKTYKFCNVFRAADRVSQYLIREVCYPGSQPSPDADLAFQIVAFRTFSNTATWDQLVSHLGRRPDLESLADGSFENALTEIKRSAGRLYTGAFILCATDAYGRSTKHLNHVELLKDMFLEHDLASDVAGATSLQQVYSLLHSYPLMGDFMSYQVAIDFNYSALTDFDENDFTMPGPGALRGIKKVFEDTNGLSPQQVIMWMVDHQQDEFDRLGLQFHGLEGRAIHAIDAQNLFCETDKYCREAVPGLSSARTRIKAKFTPAAEPISYFYPPKWHLDVADSKAEARVLLAV